MTLRRVEVSNSNSAVYRHSNNRIAVIVEGENIEEEILKDIAMHVAAMSPQFLSRDDISEDIINSETELAKTQLADKLEGKPENVAAGMIQGKVNKVLAEGILLEQDFVKDPSKKVKDLQGAGKVTNFIRVEVGEGIEKKEENFAEEVAKQIKG
jgi:elongation factor Ts